MHRHEFVEDGLTGNREATLTRWKRCACGLGLRERYLAGTLFEVRVQVERMGDWINPAVLLSLELPFKLCDRCRGRRCSECRDLGVVYA